MLDIKVYKATKYSKTGKNDDMSLCDDVLEILLALSNWTKKSRDPVFSGLELHNRVKDISNFAHVVVNEDEQSILSEKEDKVMKRVNKYLDLCISKTKRVAAGLERIREIVKKIVDILDAESESKEIGLQRLCTLSDSISNGVNEKKITKFEKEFAVALKKFV
jgi:hypothetical protein